MGRDGSFAELVEACRTRGCTMEPKEFAAACARLARAVRPDWERECLDDHLASLIAIGDRYAAAMLLLPAAWGYRVSRSLDAQVTAAVELPDGRGWQEEVCSDNEGAAVLGALAATLGAVIHSL